MKTAMIQRAEIVASERNVVNEKWLIVGWIRNPNLGSHMWCNDRLGQLLRILSRTIQNLRSKWWLCRAMCMTSFWNRNNSKFEFQTSTNKERKPRHHQVNSLKYPKDRYDGHGPMWTHGRYRLYLYVYGRACLWPTRYLEILGQDTILTVSRVLNFIQNLSLVYPGSNLLRFFWLHWSADPSGTGMIHTVWY